MSGDEKTKESKPVSAMVFTPRVDRKINWEKWHDMFNKEKLLDERLDAAAFAIAEARNKDYFVVNVTHFDTDGYMSAKLLQIFFEYGKKHDKDCYCPNFESFQETKREGITHKIYEDIKAIGLRDQKRGLLLISTDLRMMEGYCKALDNLQEIVDAPLLSIDHHVRKKRIKNLPHGVDPNSIEFELGNYPDEFIDYNKPDNANGRAHDWGVEEKQTTKPFLDIDTNSYQYPATLIVYEILERASKLVKNPPRKEKLIPFAAVGILGDKANLQVGNSLPRGNALEIIDRAHKLKGEQIDIASDWIELVGYALPSLSGSIWSNIAGMNNISDLFKKNAQGSLIPKGGTMLAKERQRIINRFWKKANEQMNEITAFHYGMKTSHFEIDGYKYDLDLSVPVINKLSSVGRSSFFAIYLKDQPNFNVYLRRSDGQVNLVEVMDYIVDKNCYPEPIYREGNTAVGLVVFNSKKDLRVGLERYLEKCKEVRQIENKLKEKPYKTKK